MFEPERLYVIGDIHGRSDLLDRLADEIIRDLDTRPVASALTVTLGDYVDRGPDFPRRDRSAFMQPVSPQRSFRSKGNHEALMAAFLANPATAGPWLHLGGLETLHSYGVQVKALMMEKHSAKAAADLRAADAAVTRRDFWQRCAPA